MERYSEYKDSGVKWLGEIPSHWEVMSIKYTGIFENGLTYSPADTAKEGTLVLRSSNIQDFHLSFKDNVFVKKVSSKLLVRKGDIIICSRNGSASLVGKCALVESDIEASFGAFMMRYRPVINPKYAYYLFQGSIGYYKGLFSTTTINQLTKSVLNDIKVAIPNLEEQVVIGSYLDAATSKIDKAIAMQQKMIDLLNERKQIIIQNAVTKGLDDKVEMKDSGVEWIGMIPKHWGLYPLRKYLNVNSKRNMPNAQLLSVTREEGVIVRNTESKEENHNFIPDDLSNYKYVRKGQFVINKMKSWQGSYGVSNFNGIVSPAYFVYDLNYPNTTYFSMAIRSKMFSPFFSKYSKGIRIDQWDLVPEALKIIPFLEPPVEEQIEIVEYLGNLIPKIESKISNCQRQITLLQERKQIIINEVVTGKVKVS